MRLTKRILAMILSVLMIVTSANVMTFAADATPTITVSSAAGMAGGTVAVTISMSGSPGVVSAMLDVDYDSDVLTLTGVTDGGLFDTVDHYPPAEDEAYPDPYRLAWSGDTMESAVEGDGTMATLYFEIRDDAPLGESEITISVPQEGPFRDFYGNVKNFALVNGGVTVVSEDAPRIEVGSAKGRAGGTVDVTVSLANNPGIAGAIFDVHYDDRFSVSNIVVGDAFNTLVFTAPADLTESTLRFVWDGQDNDYSNGTLVTLTFEIPEDIEIGKYPITITYDTEGGIFTFVDDNIPEYVTVAIIEGYVNVVSYTYGDANDDGKINTIDLALIRRAISGGYTVTGYIPEAADVNLDGKVNTIDLALIRRFISGGYGVTLGK